MVERCLYSLCLEVIFRLISVVGYLEASLYAVVSVRCSIHCCM